MQKSSYIAISREQFKQLREAKRIVKEEFEAELKLQDPDVLDRLYEYALDSENDALFNIFEALNGSSDAPPKPANEAPAAPSTETARSGPVAIGDIVDGRKCVSIYRGKPVFKDL